jgi:formylmethanofuran dehydrogenase subunit C
MTVLRLSLRSSLTEPVSLDAVTPDRLATLAAADIARLPLWVGRRQAELGDFFVVTGGPSPIVRCP